MALLAFGIATLYQGRHDRSSSAGKDLLALPHLPAAHRAEVHVSLALIACHRGGDLAVAHLLVALDRPETAALLLAAASAVP